MSRTSASASARFQLLDAGRGERHDLHVDAGRIHGGDALVAEIAKFGDDFLGAGVIEFFGLLLEVAARTVEKGRSGKVLFERDGAHGTLTSRPFPALVIRGLDPRIHADVPHVCVVENNARERCALSPRIAQHDAGAAGGREPAAQFFERPAVVVGDGNDVAPDPAHAGYLFVQHNRLAIADQSGVAFLHVAINFPSLTLGQMRGDLDTPARHVSCDLLRLLLRRQNEIRRAAYMARPAGWWYQRSQAATARPIRPRSSQ